MLLDLHLPLKSGIDLLRDIAPSHAGARLPVVVYSSFADRYEKELANLGIGAIIDKSATGPDVVEIVKGAIAEWQQRESSPEPTDDES